MFPFSRNQEGYFPLESDNHPLENSNEKRNEIPYPIRNGLKEANVILNALSNDLSPSMNDIQESITQVSSILLNVEINLQTTPLESLQKTKILSQVQEMKNQLATWKNKLNRYQKNSLLQLDSNEVSEYGQSRKMREKMEKTSLILKDSESRLENSIKLLNQSEEQGIVAMGTLREQRGRLQNSKEKLSMIEGEQRIGNRSLSRMEWRRLVYQMILIGIIIGLIIAIIFVFYFGVIRKIYKFFKNE